MSRVAVAVVAALVLAPVLARADPLRGKYHQLAPDVFDEQIIWSHAKDGITTAIDLCVKTNGKVSSVKVTHSSGDPKFDKLVVRTMKKRRYKPYQQDGNAVAVCAATLVDGITKEEKRREESGEPPPPPTVMTLVPQVFEALRQSGDPAPQPDAATKDQIAQAGKTRAIAAFKVCIDASGKESSVTMLKGSGFSTWDDQVTATFKAWTFKPYVDRSLGAMPACTAETVIYTP